MSRRTPLVDGALTDPLGIPSGVDTWLRRIEENARDLYSRLQETITTTEPVLGPAQEAFSELDRLLNDPLRSALHRILHRPLVQLSLDTPAARSFHRYATDLFERAGEAIALQHEARTFRAETAGVRQRYQEQFPRSLARHFRAARLESGDLLGVRRSPDIRAMRTRLGRVDSILARLAHETPGWDPPSGLTGDEGDAPTLQELWALTRLRLRERETAVASPSLLDPLRRLAARHINDLGEEASSHRGPSHPSHLGALVVAERVLEAGGRNIQSGEDTLLWPSLLAAAGAEGDAAAKGAWSPRLQADPGEEAGGGSATTYFVIPIDDDYALISREHHSGVSVSSRRIGMGERVECSLHSAPGDPYDLSLAALDISPLFEGVDAGQPARYGTRQRAELRIISQHENYWYARILRRGRVAVEAMGGAHEPPKPRTLRVLQRASSANWRSSVVDVQPVSAARDFGGIRTRLVQAPVAGTGELWLRSQVRIKHSDPLSDIENERELWVRLRIKNSNLVPRLVGRGRLGGQGEEGYLYIPPAALRPSDTPLLERWMSAEPATFARAIVRVFMAVQQEGYALGSYHLDAFAFRIGDGKLRSLHPRAVLLHGAMATRHGEAFRNVQGVADLTYPRIRFRGLPPSIASGGAAGPEADALGFGLVLLELLAVRALGAEKQWYTWTELLEAVREGSDHFARPKLAVQLARSLAGEEAAGALLTLVGQLAREG